MVLRVVVGQQSIAYACLIDSAADYIDSMLKAIVGFRLPIERLIGKRKLSQNRSAVDQAGVRNGLLANNNPQDHALARLIAKE